MAVRGPLFFRGKYLFSRLNKYSLKNNRKYALEVNDFCEGGPPFQPQKNSKYLSISLCLCVFPDFLSELALQCRELGLCIQNCLNRLEKNFSIALLSMVYQLKAAVSISFSKRIRNTHYCNR